MFKTVLVAVDVAMETEARRILRAAAVLTADWDCALHVINVVPPIGMPIVGSFLEDDFEERSMEAARVQLMEALADTGVEAKTHVHMGKVYDTVLAQAAALGTDLILVGAHQPDLQDYLLGANAARIVRHSKCSVLVLRG